MYSHEIVMRMVQSDRCFQVRQLLAKRIYQARESAEKFRRDESKAHPPCPMNGKIP
jgi:hypothetical protein